MPTAISQRSEASIEDVWAAWFDGQTPNSNLAQIISESSGGHCYLKLLCYFYEFGKVEPVKLHNLLVKLKGHLGPDPLAKDALTEVCMVYFTLLKTLGGEERVLGDIKDEDVDELTATFTGIYDSMKNGPVKMDVLYRDKHIHIQGNPRVDCSCSTVVCQHGYSLKGVSSLMVFGGVRIGASGFDMNAFLNGGMDEDEDFEDVYSSLTVKQPASPRVEKWVTDAADKASIPSELSVKPKAAKGHQCGARPHQVSKYLQAEGFAPQPNDGRTTEKTRRDVKTGISSVISADSEPNQVIADLQKQMKILTETVARSTLSVQESLDPNDSSSVAERYVTNKRFMNHGTVIGNSPVLNHHGAAVGSTMLTVEDSLVSGFVQDDVSIERERHFVGKLKPVNGLPRPFANNRLNFLINFSTGLERSLERYPNEMLRSLYHSMSTDSVVPVDNLVRQVLCITIDRHEGIVVSNPFKLPYIEIGMHISQATITAMIDLAMAEFRQCWFQEFKGLRIPEFWNVYQGMSQEPVQQVSKRRTEPRSRETRPAPQKVSRTKTLLGF